MEARDILVVPSRITEITGFPPLPRMQQEIYAITSNHNALVLNEPVRWIDLLRAATNEKSYNVIHLAGHLTDSGLVLGSEIISSSQIITVIQTIQPDIVVINTCSSESAAERIASQCTSDVIYTIADLDNDVAISFAILFYSKLRHVESYKEAFDVSATGDSIFRYLPGRYRPIMRGDTLAAEVAEIRRALNDPLTGNGLVQRVSVLEGIWRRFEPVLLSIEATYRSTKTIPANMFYVILITISVLAFVAAALVYFERGGV